jgi:GNAT superfamily N-acetyltransferase
MRRSVTIRYLEMLSPQELRPARPPSTPVELRRAEIPCPPLNRFLYTAVGGDWYWVDRLPWSYAQWQAYLERPELETWVAFVAGTPAGYFELERQPEEQVEIAYFGLLLQFIGRGLGGWLLTAAVQRAWEMDARRVWVHTCTLDGPTALQNYLSRGFRLYREETTEVELPDQPPGPWQGAYPDAPNTET